MFAPYAEEVIAMQTMTRRRKLPTAASSVIDKVNKVDAVLCSDIHYRSDIPRCRVDDFQSAMNNKLEFIFNLCRQYNVPLFCGGDVGDKPIWPDWLLTKFIKLAKDVKIYSALGQHDLPGHSLEEFERSGCGVLGAGNVIEFYTDTYPMGVGIFMAHWDKEIPHINNEMHSSPVLLTHRLVIQGKKEWPDQQAYIAENLLKEWPQYKLILSGDNHIPFVVKYQGRLLVNPGSIMRSSVAQIDHKPRVYLWDSEANEVSPVYLPIEQNVIDRTHIDVVDEKQARRQDMVDRIKKGYEVSIDFEKNIENYFDENDVSENIRKRVLLACEERKK